MINEILLKEKYRERENVLEMWARDVKTLNDKKNFNPYSWLGKRKLSRVSNKYSTMLVEIEDEIAKMEEEIDK